MSEVTNNPNIADSALPDNVELSADLIKEYLLDHPEFFIQHPELLTSLRLPHQQRGTISLAERQLEVQRQKAQFLEEEITHLISIARQNEHIFSVFSEIFIQIFDASDEQELLESIRALMQERLKLTGVELLKLTEKEQSLDNLEFKKLTNFVGKRLQDSTTYFGRLSQDELNLFFNPTNTNGEIKSVAIMALGEESTAGLVAFGSAEEDHYYPGMDTLFIDELGRVLTLLLERFDYV